MAVADSRKEISDLILSTLASVNHDAKTLAETYVDAHKKVEVPRNIMGNPFVNNRKPQSK
jgi:hypothetical protein